MPAELQQQIKAIPLHAYVTWELTPWYQLETEHRTDYTPATGVNPGWNSGPLGLLFWIYQATDSGDNTLVYEAYVAGYVATVACHTQLSGRVNLWKGFLSR